MNQKNNFDLTSDDTAVDFEFIVLQGNQVRRRTGPRFDSHSKHKLSINCLRNKYYFDNPNKKLYQL